MEILIGLCNENIDRIKQRDQATDILIGSCNSNGKLIGSCNRILIGSSSGNIDRIMLVQQKIDRIKQRDHATETLIGSCNGDIDCAMEN